MGKEELRKGMLLSMEKIGWMERNKTEKALHDQLFDSDLWETAHMIGITVSSEKEWDTRQIIEQAWSEGKHICVPRAVHETREMYFHEITSFDQLEKGYFNLLEPINTEDTLVSNDSIDLLVVPGLLFTKAGYRIGFGGGFFDRFLQDYKHTTVSLMHSNQLIDSFPIEPHDVPVDFLITEESIIKTSLLK